MSPNKKITQRKTKFGFSLIELSVTILIIGILVVGLTAGSRMIAFSKLSSARQVTSSSTVASVEGLILWMDAAGQQSFQNANDSFDITDGNTIKNWHSINPQSTTPIIATQALDEDRPTYDADGMNGLPTVRFDSDENFANEDRLSTNIDS